MPLPSFWWFTDNLGVLGFAEFIWRLTHCFLKERRKVETVTRAFSSLLNTLLESEGNSGSLSSTVFIGLYSLDWQFYKNGRPDDVIIKEKSNELNQIEFKMKHMKE